MNNSYRTVVPTSLLRCSFNQKVTYSSAIHQTFVGEHQKDTEESGCRSLFPNRTLRNVLVHPKDIVPLDYH